MVEECVEREKAVFIPPSLHRGLKLLAFKHNLTIKILVIKLLKAAIADEEFLFRALKGDDCGRS